MKGRVAISKEGAQLINSGVGGGGIFRLVHDKVDRGWTWLFMNSKV
jgi:hypothetical protein